MELDQGLGEVGRLAQIGPEDVVVEGLDHLLLDPSSMLVLQILRLWFLGKRRRLRGGGGESHHPSAVRDEQTPMGDLRGQNIPLRLAGGGH